jgi:hypothetical protein
VFAGSFTHQDVAGANKLGFSGRLNGRALAKGAYRLTDVAKNAAGKTSLPATAFFKIV